MPPLKAFLLCAGDGKRFYPHTQVLPKPFLPFLNIPLLAFNFFLLKGAGLKKVALNTHKKAFLFKKHLPALMAKADLDLPFLSHEPKLLGSAGGLLKLKSFFKEEEHFFYLNGDSMIIPLSQKEELLNNFYESHIESGALASFLVRPAHKASLTGIRADPKTGQVHSFAKKPKAFLNSNRYDFSGLAIFSSKIFNEIPPKAFHIFKDVLEALTPHLRVHSVSSLKLLDMNQLSSYLRGTKTALKMLSLLLAEEKGATKGFYQAGRYLKNVLDIFSPGWDFFRSENYFSATKLKDPLPDKKSLLFCGKKVKGLKYLSLKDFAVLGDYSELKSPLLLEQAVLGQNTVLNQSLKSELYL